MKLCILKMCKRIKKITVQPLICAIFALVEVLDTSFFSIV